MILHYYAPAVPESYCVGIHNGHGIGSVFARLFSKVAAKTAAKAATTVAKTAGKKLVKVATTKGMQLGKKALNTVAKEGVKAVKEYGPKVLTKAGKVASEFATQKIDSVSDEAIKRGVPAEVVHSFSNAAKTGLNKTGNKVVSAVTNEVNTLLNQVGDSTEKKVAKTRIPIARSIRKKNLTKLAGVKRKAPKFSHPAKKRKINPNLSNIIEEA